jgi:signal transduction histidine kinase
LRRDARTHGKELSAISFRVVVNGSRQDIAPLVRDSVYQVAREAIANAFRHSAASHIEVEITYEARQFLVAIRDDGVGFVPALIAASGPDHWGIQGMRTKAKESGGALSIWTREKAGTEVRIVYPARLAFARS